MDRSSATYERVRFIILVSERSVSSDSEFLVRAMEQCLALSAAPFPPSHLTLAKKNRPRHVETRQCAFACNTRNALQVDDERPGTASTTKSNSMCAALS